MLLERQHEMDLLDRAMSAARDGNGSIVFVVGEAGIGKTSLVSEFASESGVEGRARILRTAFEDLSTPEAFAVLRDLDIVDQASIDSASDGESRLSLFSNVLAELARQPTLLVIEDLHWADDASMDLIRYLGRRVSDWPLMVLVTSRNEEAGARGRLQRALADIPAESRTRIDLHRLSANAVDEWARRLGRDASGLFDTSGGNPLFVNELLASCGVSAMIDDLVITRADALSESGRDVLDRCSIVPRQVPFALADRLGLAEGGVAECLAAGLLIEKPDALSFRHELTRQAVEQALSPMRRRRLHREMLSLLEQSGASAARLLHHANAAGDLDKVKALAPAAARQASGLGAHREAAATWRTVLDLADSLDEQQLVEVLEGLAYELHLNGEPAESVKLINQAISIHERTGDLPKQGNAHRWKSRFFYVDGNFDMARQSALAAVDLLQPLGEGVELAMAFSTLSQLAMLNDDVEECLEWGERAIDMARALGRFDIVAHATNNVGAALHTRDPEKSEQVLREAQALCRQHGLHEEYCRALTNHYSTLAMRRKAQEALALAKHCVAFSIEHDIDLFRRYAMGFAALCEVILGDWDAAREYVRTATADGGGTRLSRNPAIRAACQMAIRRGQDATAYLDEMEEHASFGRESQRFLAYALLAAEHCWTTGDRSPNRINALNIAWDDQKPDSEPWDVGALWYWRRLLLGIDEVPKYRPLPYPMILVREGRIDDAYTLAENAGLTFLTAQILAEGDEAHAQRAIRVLDRLGATATLDRIRAGLSARGIRTGTRGPRKSTRENPHGLTKRELDVLALIDQGLTNKDIGEKLFVSAKTVDHHVSSLLGKLGARNRSEAAAIGRAEGLVQSQADG